MGLKIYVIYGLILAIISVIDYKKYYIPDFLTLCLIFLGVGYRGIYLNDLEGMMVGAGVITIPLLLLYGYVSEFLKKEVLGFGDIKLTMGIGGVVGNMVMEKFYLFYLIAFLSATFYGTVLLLVKKEKYDGRIPMGPFISLAGVLICL